MRREAGLAVLEEFESFGGYAPFERGDIRRGLKVLGVTVKDLAGIRERRKAERS